MKLKKHYKVCSLLVFSGENNKIGVRLTSLPSLNNNHQITAKGELFHPRSRKENIFRPWSAQAY